MLEGVPLPVKRPTNCVFGGPDLDILYVTSARNPMSEAELHDQPLAGSLLAVRTGCPGLCAFRFGPPQHR